MSGSLANYCPLSTPHCLLPIMNKTKEQLIDELKRTRLKTVDLEQCLIEAERIKEDREEARVALRESEELFHAYFERGPIGMAITSPREKRWIKVNPRICDLLGYSREELLNITWPEITHPDDIEKNIEQFNRVLAGESEGYRLKKRFFRKDGSIIYISLYVRCIRNTDGSVKHVLALLQDITEHKKAEDDLKFSEKTLRARKDELEKKTTTLSGLLQHIEIEKKQIKDNVASNVEGLLLPLLEKMNPEMSNNGRKYLALLKKNLKELTASFGYRVLDPGLNLTPREIGICNMIKSGLNSRKISEILKISRKTVDRHRDNIRKKLGISNRKINLRSFLQNQ
jgi:PAS domain S-box-containing protein